MKKFNSFHSLNVFSLELEQWEFEYHDHNFYELIFIESGMGKHHLNDLVFNYAKGDIFLLTPNDAHEFIISEKTKFTYIKFTEQLFREKLIPSKKSNWEEALQLILVNQPVVNESIIKDQDDCTHLFVLVKILLYEFKNDKLYSNEAVLELFALMMSIITRNLSVTFGTNLVLTNDKERLNNILTYIRIHVLDAEKMRIHNMAHYFSMSTNYIGIYVKKHTSLSIQQHITQHKLKASEKLLKQSRYTINEIASRLGFTDSSHFNKFFKKHKGITPSLYK